ncbi:glycosyltransferase family 2 protein [Alteromonas sp. H39]|uniref:glycosyltransferase family 2 protein n=1 Tax=Alteromonas sp. H39 TaxID=3389876 RepID=UPI0039E0C902
MSQAKPQITVLIPCYNVADYLEEALTSIVRQTETDLEILCLNDGSTDNTGDILRRFANEDPRFRLLNHTQNQGIINSRNTLLAEARGHLLAWFDADDIAHPNRLSKQKAFLEQRSDHIAVTCEYIEFSEHDEIYRKRDPRDVSRETLLFYNYVLNPGTMVRADVLKEASITFDETLAGASDYQFWVDVSRHGQIGVIHEPLMRYRRHNQQESTAQIRRQLQGCQQIVTRQLAAMGVNIPDENLMAQFLIYPADILKLPYSTKSMRTAALIGAQILSCYERASYTDEVAVLTVHLLRRHAVRTGLAGLYYFTRTVGLKKFLEGKYFGAALALDCLRRKY